MSQTSQSTLRIRKQSSSSVIDLEDSTYKMRLTECQMLFASEVKEAPTVDFPDEDGVDSYDNASTKMKAFDATFNLAFTSASPTGTHTAIKWLLDYLTSNGALHQVFCPWAGIGRQKCRFKKLDNITQHRNSITEYVVEFSLTFTIEDPTTDINAF